MKKYLALLLVLLLLTGCASKSAAPETAASEPMMDMPAAAMSAPEPTAQMANAGGAGELNFAPAEEPAAVEESREADVEAGGAAGPDGGAEPVEDVGEKLIYRADLTVETTEFDAAVAALEALAPSVGGFVESSNVSGNTTWQPDGTTRVVDRWANYVLRVPAGRFQETVQRAGDLGSVVNSGTSVENITSQFTDQEARQHSLEVQEERLLSMLEKAEDVDTLVILESRLSEVRYEIESIERQLRNWQRDVDYSTVSVNLSEVAVYTPTATVQRSYSERLGGAFRDGWNSFVHFLERLSLGFASSLPMLVLLAAVIVAVVVLILAIRRKRRRVEKTKAAEPEDKKE